MTADTTRALERLTTTLERLRQAGNGPPPADNTRICSRCEQPRVRTSFKRDHQTGAPVCALCWTEARINALRRRRR